MPTNDRDPRWTEAYSLGVLQWLASQPEWSQAAADQAVDALVAAGHSRLAASDAVHASRYGVAMSGMLMLATEEQVIADMVAALRSHEAVIGHLITDEGSYAEQAAAWRHAGFCAVSMADWLAVGVWDHEIAAALVYGDVRRDEVLSRAAELESPDGPFAGRDVVMEVCLGEIDVDVLLG